jgi:hypothetical protein
VTITLRDATASTPTLAGSAVRFEGVLLDRGNSVIAVQTNGAGMSQLQLERPALASGCTLQTLGGSFGVSAFGLDIGAEPANALDPRNISPFAFVGRVFADGNGNLVQDTAGGNSPLTRRQLVGRYTINPDCTGTMTITGSADTSDDPPIPGVPGGDNGGNTTLSFVLTQAQISTQAGGPPVTGQPRPEILFVFNGGRFPSVGRGR